MKISDISWDTVRMVSIDNCTLRITTDIAVHTYAFDTADELSEALLVLSLKGTKKVEFVDESRFNPARFMPGYNRDQTQRVFAVRRPLADAPPNRLSKPARFSRLDSGTSSPDGFFR